MLASVRESMADDVFCTTSSLMIFCCFKMSTKLACAKERYWLACQYRQKSHKWDAAGQFKYTRTSNESCAQSIGATGAAGSNSHKPFASRHPNLGSQKFALRVSHGREGHSLKSPPTYPRSATGNRGIERHKIGNAVTANKLPWCIFTSQQW